MIKTRILFTRAYAVLVAIFMIFSGSKWLGENRFYFIGFGLAALFFVAVASAGRLWCSLYIAGNKNKRLITEGPYSISRNPLYFFSLVGLVGIGLATMTFTIPLLLLLSFFFYYPFVIRREESNLQKLFPTDFPDYMKSVPRFVPKSLQLVEPPMCEVNPRVFRNHMLSVIWFGPIAGVVLIVSLLHELGIFPTFWTLY